MQSNTQCSDVQEAQLQLREQGVSLVLSNHHTLGNFLLSFIARYL